MNVKTPVLLVVDPAEGARRQVTEALTHRFGSDYRVLAEVSAEAGLQRLRALRADEVEVPIVFADYEVPGVGGTELLAQVRSLSPDTRRALLVDIGDISCAGTLLQALTFSQADDYIRKPFQTPDERFYRAVSTLLDEWAALHRDQFQLVRIVGEQWAPRSYQLRDMMARGGIPSVFYDADSEEGQALLTALGLEKARLPVCVLYNAEVLIDPSDAALDEAIGIRTHARPVRYDVAIVGAGPAGMSAAVYAASEGLATVVIETAAPGGQAGSSSMVRNYLGFPRGISGGELMRAAYRQAWLFQAQFVFSSHAAALEPDGDEWTLVLSNGDRVHSRTVLLAMGMTYRSLRIPGVDRLIGSGVYYGTAVSEAQAMRGKPVYIVGGGNSAGQAAVHLAKYASRVTLLLRGADMSSMSDYLVQEVHAAPNIAVRYRTQVTDGRGDQRLEALQLRDSGSGRTETVTAAALFILIGGRPHTDWLPPTLQRDGQGYLLTGHDLLAEAPIAWPLQRAPLPLETSLPGVMAAGDLRHGAPKRIASAVGEGAIAIENVHRYLALQEQDAAREQPRPARSEGR